MWIGGYRGKFAYSGMSSAYYFEPTAGGPLADVEFYVFTFLAGRLVVQVVSPSWTRVEKTQGATAPDSPQSGMGGCGCPILAP
jgi:hypothetical protein